MRTGIGYDIHRLIPSEGGRFSLGGIEIPAPFTVKAHSDGDVLLHAITDACLGALALGDIGQWFPDNDPKHKNRNSSEFLVEILRKVNSLGYRVHNVDSNVILENPKLAPHADSIRAHVARLLSVEVSRISFKAKTKEGLGPVGEGLAIEANAVVTLVPLKTHGS